MNKDDILNMPAGYGIRKLLGEKVMGWNQQGKWWVGKHSIVFPVSIWKPDKNPDYAWGVEQRIFDDELAVFYVSNLIYIVNKEENLRVVGDWVQYYYIAHSKPMQKCRAALLAVMDSKNA